MKDSPYKAFSMVYGKNLYDLDLGLKILLNKYLGREPDFRGFGNYVTSELLEVIDFVDKVGQPRSIHWNLKGERVDDIWVSPELRRELDKMVAFYGVNRPPIHEGDWISHLSYLYMIGDAGVECILTVTIQTAFALHKYGDNEMKHIASHMFGDELPIYYGATWFSEVNAGSDLGNIETVAKLEDGVWRLYGVKYFTSNIGFADYALVVARPENNPPGVKGLSLFLMPTRDGNGKPNYKLIRLKDKLGTVNVPTGEVELEGSYALPIGELKKGSYYALENLMISRLANTFGAVGLARRSILEALLYGLERIAFGRRLIDHVMVRGDILLLDALSMADLSVAFKAARLWEKVQEETPPYSEDYAYARVYNHMAKAVTAKHAIFITAEAMELLGGRGFLKDFMMERLHREALVTSIWEGTTNIHSLDFIEALIVKGGYKRLLDDLSEAMNILGLNQYKMVKNEVEYIEGLVKNAPKLGEHEVVRRSKEVMFELFNVIGLSELVKLGDLDTRYQYLAEIFYRYSFENRYPDMEVIKEFSNSLSFEVGI